jgi:hypothetical protein
MRVQAYSKVRRMTIVAGGLLAALALSTGAAQAAAPRLVLTEGVASPMPVGQRVAFSVVNGSAEQTCVQTFRDGNLESNDKPKDKTASFVGATDDECFGPGETVAGGLSEVQLSGSGTVKVKFKPKEALHETGPCVYEYSALEGKLQLSGDAIVEGSATGKLNAKKSSISCAATETSPWVGLLYHEYEFEDALGAAGYEVRG